VRPRGCGGIGRRARFRSVWGQPRGGSSPLIRITPSGRFDRRLVQEERAFYVVGLLAASRASLAANEPKGRTLRCVQLALQRQIDPERRPRLRIAQLNLGRLHARRREADDNVGPPVIGDGVSDQHVPQFAPPRDVSLSFAREEPASTHQRYGLLARGLYGSESAFNGDAASCRAVST
jgi:hypothetical protein